MGGVTAENEESVVSPTSESKAYELNERIGPKLRKHPGVAGVGVGRDPKAGYYLSVHLVNEAAKIGLPEQIEGTPVKYEVTGEYRPLKVGLG